MRIENWTLAWGRGSSYSGWRKLLPKVHPVNAAALFQNM